MAREGENSDDLSGEKIGDTPPEKTGFQEMGIDFLGENESPEKSKTLGGFCEVSASPPQRDLNFGSQELTLSYLCENSKLGFPEKDVSGRTLLGKYKGKEIADRNDEDNNNVCVERDFLQLNEINRGNSSKREFSENLGGENREKKPKVESLNLSLALPDVSLSLAGSNRLPSRLRPSRSLQSLGPSFNNTCSNDFTAASLSYSYSHQFSHNASCSLTRNSTDNYDCDQIWNCGEGTNGSVHSRFRPIGDGTVALSNGFGPVNRNGFNKDPCNNNNSSLHRTTSSDNISFFPSELQARPAEDVGLVKAHGFSTPERILREMVSESVPVMAQIVQELTNETVESVKAHLMKSIVDNSSPETRDDVLAGLQRRLERRSDLSRETLSKCHRNQLEIMVAIKMGLGSFLKNQLPTAELCDIFLLERCRNINCRRLLPVEDCDCKICSSKKGFCSECMCPVCLNFDCANNTCSWVGCDACSHWCHAACGLKRNLIRPSPCLETGSSSLSVGGTEMQFHCLGCGHASEMFGFVKEVFMSCAKEWSLENLMKELDCVGKVFEGSEDRKGKELGLKAVEMLGKLRNRIMSPPEVCDFIFRFFNSAAHNYMDIGPSSMPSTHKDASLLLTPKPSLYNTNGPTPFDLYHTDIKVPTNSEKIIEDEWSVKPVVKKGSIDSLESLVRIKEAEAQMFQGRADEARTEIDGYRRMVRLKTEKLEEEYGEKVGKLSVQEVEERRRKKAEELKLLENSHCDYYKMKIRMQSEISGLLKRMEATKQQLA